MTPNPALDPPGPVVLRSHRPGDVGWVVWRHAEVYARERGWGFAFEAVVADVMADFLRNFDPGRERCWIAELEGRRVGSIFCVRHPDAPTEVARLRALLVEPSARGFGVGRRLVEACVQFARESGYRRMTLWTADILESARRIYAGVGFRCIHREPFDGFGPAFVSETWELDL